MHIMTILPFKVKNKAESFSKSHFSSSWLLVDLRNLLPSTDRWAFVDSWGSSVIVATAPCSISSLLQAQGTLQRLQTSHIRNNHISPCRKTRNENHEYVCVTHQNSEFFTCQNIMAADKWLVFSVYSCQWCWGPEGRKWRGFRRQVSSQERELPPWHEILITILPWPCFWWS